MLIRRWYYNGRRVFARSWGVSGVNKCLVTHPKPRIIMLNFKEPLRNILRHIGLWVNSLKPSDAYTHLKVSSAKWQPFSLGLNVLKSSCRYNRNMNILFQNEHSGKRINAVAQCSDEPNWHLALQEHLRIASTANSRNDNLWVPHVTALIPLSHFGVMYYGLMI